MQYKDLDKLFIDSGFWEKDYSCELFEECHQWDDFMSKFNKIIPKTVSYRFGLVTVEEGKNYELYWTEWSAKYDDEWRFGWVFNRPKAWKERKLNKFVFKCVEGNDEYIPQDILDKIKNLLNEFIPFIKDEERLAKKRKEQEEREKEEEENRQLQIKKQQQWDAEERKIQQEKEKQLNIEKNIEKNYFKSVCRMIIKHGSSVAPIVSYFLEHFDWNYLDFEKELDKIKKER
jgi:hypothetical protein